jgi:hypothetical protein
MQLTKSAHADVNCRSGGAANGSPALAPAITAELKARNPF